MGKEGHCVSRLSARIHLCLLKSFRDSCREMSHRALPCPKNALKTKIKQYLLLGPKLGNNLPVTHDYLYDDVSSSFACFLLSQSFIVKDVLYHIAI